MMHRVSLLIFLVDLQIAKGWRWGGQVCRGSSKPQTGARKEKDGLPSVSTYKIHRWSLMAVLGKPFSPQVSQQSVEWRKDNYLKKKKRVLLSEKEK